MLGIDFAAYVTYVLACIAAGGVWLAFSKR